MSKISEIFKVFKQDVHELDNAEKLKNLSPIITMYDIHHQFSVNKKQTQAATDVFDKILEKQPNVFHCAFNNAAYVEENAQNKLLLHGILFNALFNVYLKHFKKGFDNVLLSDLPIPESDDMCYFLSEERPGENRKIIDFTEYAKLPKRYRCLFVQYDSDHYTLNIPHEAMVIAYNKKNKTKIEKLLLRAKMLIPVIYRQNIAFGFPTTFTAPAIAGKELNFVPDSPSAKRVSDEQLKTVLELHDIFIEIAKYTFVIETNARAKAHDVYDEYIREATQKDTVLSAHSMDKNDKSHMEKSIDKETKEFEARKKSIEENYIDNRDRLLREVSRNISVRIK